MEPVHDDADYDEMEDEDEPPRRTRYGLIAASLIGAIAVGGGLAYAYKIYATPPVIASVTPVIKSGSAPNKVKPSDPGGTKFANADSKMMDSLARAQSSGDSSSDGAPKKVQTMTVERDGSITTSALPSPPPPPLPAPSSGASAVPGMIVIGAPPPPAAAPQPVTIQPPAATAKPAQRVAAAQPPPAAYPDAVDPPVAAPKKPVPPAKKPTPPSAVGGPTGANGFVAVLASVPASANSRMQAMQQFADLQQKYAGPLGGKAPDVVEAKLEKGTFHRLVVGPPASRDAAGSVCTQLKAAGYTADCWVTPF
jgi:hypothetical protein